MSCDYQHTSADMMDKFYLTASDIMIKPYTLTTFCNYALGQFIFFLVFSFLFAGKASAQVKDSTITAIYTDYKTYWNSSTTSLNAVLPDSSHNLLAFTFRGKTYSTGVSDATLTAKLGAANYVARVFKALPVSNIAGTVPSGTSTYIATASKNDGDSSKAAYTSPYPNIRIADVLTDGKNGLDLGTGVTNLPASAHISFPIKTLNAKLATDSVPDLIFTQIADPSSGTDTIYFYDANGNMVGNRKLISWGNVAKLGTYKLDLYTLAAVSCNASTITGAYTANTTRDIRMVSYLLTEFGITNSTLAASVKGLQINPNGTSDQAFIAYNTNLITIDVPVISAQPQTQIFCSTATTSATFSVIATSGTAMSYQWKKNGAAIAGATSATYTATGLTLADTANAYTVSITNSSGVVTSDNAYVKYIITAQPSSGYVATGSSATLTVGTSGATGYQWSFGTVPTAILGATKSSYTIASAAAVNSGNYSVAVSSPIGTCTSNTATLTVENLPLITVQPQQQRLCDTTSKSVTFSVTATSTSTLSYQWFKNGILIPGATVSTYTAVGLTYADTSNAYTVSVTSRVGTVTSSSAGFKYVILTQPSNLYIATGTTAALTIGTSGATAIQWQKAGSLITGATLATLTINAAVLSDSGSYRAVVTASGTSCTSNAAIVTVENPPVITSGPKQQVLCDTSFKSATFSVTATSTSALTYQWYKNGTAITGAIANTYTSNGLSYADTASTYIVKITNGVGTTTSNSVGIKYLLLSQPVSQYVASGTTVTFTVGTSGATAFQWQKESINIGGATSASFVIPSVALPDSGNYQVIASYAGTSCTSSVSVLTVENLPVITAQPQQQMICNSSTRNTTFSVTATSASALLYQWYKNGVAIVGATATTYKATNLTYADTASTFYVVLTNNIGTTVSNSVGFKYLIFTQPSPATAYLATGNTITFSATTSTYATGFQWKKSGTNINGAIGTSYTIDTVNSTSDGNYKLVVSYNGGTCTSAAGVLTTSTILYSKATGNINEVVTWGVQPDGSGSTPLTFTRGEHIFIIANRDTANTTATLTIAGTFDVGDGSTTISGGTTLEAGRIIRSLTKGTLSGTATSGLIAHGKSDLYFNASRKILQSLLVNTIDTVTLRTPLDITAGIGHGSLKVSAGVFVTGDSLTLKSDSLGTASIGNSQGFILGKVTVERYIPARRAWRLFSAPVSASNAPTINAAWQEGATSSTDNPSPGYGTHITYGAVADGFDQNPQKTFSMKVRNSSGLWVGVPPTNATRVTDYPAYMFFVRGNRSYNIGSTTVSTTPAPAILRTTGNVNQGTQPNIPVSSTGFTLVGNPFASPLDFKSIFLHSQNIANRLRIWDPQLGGSFGAGAFVTVYWNGASYSTVPSLPGGSVLRYLQANEGFFIEGIDTAAYISLQESDKDTVANLLPFGKIAEPDASQTELAVNLKVFDGDSTFAPADGVAFLFANSYNNTVTPDDVMKLANTSENLSILQSNQLLTIEERGITKGTDSLHLYLTGVKNTNYQFEFIPASFSNSTSLFLYDKFLHTTTPISVSDTSRITININTGDALSKAADRFTIVTKTLSLLPLTITHLQATANERKKEIVLQWTTGNADNVSKYEIERSGDEMTFHTIGNLLPTGSNNFMFTDNNPQPTRNYYRVKSIDKNGGFAYSSIVNAAIGATPNNCISIYPNPVTTHHCYLNLHNEPVGYYTLKLFTGSGQAVWTTKILVNDANSPLSLTLPSFLAKGIYELEINNKNGKGKPIKLILVD